MDKVTMQEEFSEHNELYEHHRIVVDRGQSLERIDKFLVHQLSQFSRTRIQAAAQAGNILVNDNPVKPSYKVKPQDVVSIVLPHPPQYIELLPEDIPLDIVYEDDDLIILNKKAGMVVHPGHGNFSGTLINALLYHFRDLPLFQSGEMRPGLVHRIDKNTSGIMVVAKDEMALNRLAKQFFDHTIDRRYNALVWGEPSPPEGTITGHVGRNPRERTKMQVFPDGSAGRPAITHYNIIESFGYVSLVECRLETGRTHQIRVHFQNFRHPLFNDAEYGGDKILRGTTSASYRQFVQNCFTLLPRQALHARSLEFRHPRTGKVMSFDSTLPADMQQVIEKWRDYTRARSQ
jgi:23S rRNA pseudouridine1911/1915/1917 synthase